MSQKESGNTLRIAQKLVHRLPKDMRDRLTGLIQLAEGGQDPIAEIKIIKLLSSHENIRHWMKEQHNMPDVQKTINGGYIPMAGDPSAPLSEKWFCSTSNCTETFPVIQKGEDPPVCEVHKIEMIRENKEKG